jgi:hypothetical protein
MRHPITMCAVALFGLAGCQAENVTARTDEPQVGRFQFYPASGEMPAVLLDTATGCVEMFGKAVSIDNPQDVSWWRRYEDTGVAEVTYENGQGKEVPNSAPPSRCPPSKASEQ